MNRLFTTANGRRPLAPAFINRLDKWLLLNYPILWATRVHLFLWYALIGYAVIYGTFWILPDDPRKPSSLEEHQVVVGLLAALGVILWLIYLLRFNTFKRFGQPHTLSPALHLLLFWAVFFIAGFSIMLPAFVETQLAHCQYTPDELTDVVNQINYCVNVVEHEYNPVQLNPDTVIFVATEKEARDLNLQNERYSYSNVEISDTTNDSVITIALRDLYRENTSWEAIDRKDELLHSEDTLILIGNSALVRYTWQNIIYLKETRSPDYSSVRPLTPYQLYHLVYRQKTVSEAEALRTMNSISLKFAQLHIGNDYGPQNEFIGYRTDVNPADTFEYQRVNADLFEFRYNLKDIDNAIENIERRMYRFRQHDYLSTVSLVLAYLSLALSLILLLFRHSSLKTFAATFLAGIVLAVATGVGLALFKVHKEGVLITILIYILVFHAFSFGLFVARKRSLWQGIALQLSVYSVFTIPVLLVGIHYQHLRKLYPSYKNVYEFLYVNENYHYALAQCAGLALLLGMLFLLYGRMMKKWYAQPEE